jgi:hypothetical protein
MCEPFIVAKTGLSVAEHQRRTVENFCWLREHAPGLPFVPVLQGWHLSDYWRCVDLYTDAGVDLAAEPLVGLGSVCRRQSTHDITVLVAFLQATGLRLHGFGVKTGGFERYAPLLASADSMAWSYAARRAMPLAGCQHRNCANCVRFALQWRDKVIRRCSRVEQLMFDIGRAS